MSRIDSQQHIDRFFGIAHAKLVLSGMTHEITLEELKAMKAEEFIYTLQANVGLKKTIDFLYEETPEFLKENLRG